MATLLSQNVSFRVLHGAVLLVLSACGSPQGDERTRELSEQLRGESCHFDAVCGYHSTIISKFTVRHPEHNCVAWAAQCLARIPEEAGPAVPALIEALRGTDEFDTGDGVIHVRARIAEALGAVRDPRAVAPLIWSLGASKPMARISILNALDAFAESASAIGPAVMPLLADTDVRVRARAAALLAKIRYPDALPRLMELVESAAEPELIGALAVYGEAAEGAAPVLIDKLQSLEPTPETFNIRRELILALQRINAVTAVPALIQTLAARDTFPVVADALRELAPEDRQHLAQLRRYANDPDPIVRREVTYFLGRIKDRRSLIEKLTDSDPGVREAAALAIRENCIDRTSGSLLARLSDPSVNVRRAASAALIDIDSGDRGLKALTVALSDVDAQVRRNAARAIGRVGPTAEDALPILEELSRASDQELRDNALFAIGQIKQSEPSPACCCRRKLVTLD